MAWKDLRAEIEEEFEALQTPDLSRDLAAQAATRALYIERHKQQNRDWYARNRESHKAKVSARYYNPPYTIDPHYSARKHRKDPP